MLHIMLHIFYRTCLVILCIVNIYQTHIFLETMDWGNRRRLTKILTSICDGAGRRDRRRSLPVDVSFILSNEKALASGIAATVIRLTFLLSNEKALVGGIAAVVFWLTFFLFC